MIGFLFIGDPHIDSSTPGRRTDACFYKTVLGKLEEALGLANHLNLQPIILGDLFNRYDDAKPLMLNGLTRVLKTANRTPFIVPGNHDMKEERTISDGTSLRLLIENGRLIELGPETDLEFKVPSGTGPKTVRLLAVPSGWPIPRTVSKKADFTLMLTHHDLGFDGAYPGAEELFPIENCDLVVNGHIHLQKPIRTRGDTKWFNPGNITRMKIDALNHAPAAWSWTYDGSLLKYPLRHEKDVFNLAGLSVVAEDDPTLLEQPVRLKSLFSSLLAQETAAQSTRTDDATVFLDDLGQFLDEENVEPALKDLILGWA